jgi:hypothetical protein
VEARVIPIGGIIAGALLGASALNRNQKPDRQLRGFVYAFLLVFALLIAVGAFADGHWGALPFIAVLPVLLLPWATCRWLLIPLGRPKLAYYVGRLSAWKWAGDTRGGGLVAASLAAVRRPDASTWAWIEQKRNRGKELCAGGIIATAIALDARGETERARRTFATVPTLDRDGCCRTAIAMAFEWLAAEAAERGDWRNAARWGLHPPLGSRAAVTIGSVAARIAGNPWVPGRTFSNAQLWYAWAWSFRWWALRPLVRWACTQPSADVSEAEPAWVAETEAAHDRAIALQARAAMSGKRVGVTQIVTLGDAWSIALDESALDGWRTRARDLGARSNVLHDLRDAVEEELASLLRRSEADVGALVDDDGCPPLLRAAALRVRSEWLDAAESAIEALQARVAHKQALPAADEWNEWQAAVLAYERAFQRAGAHNRVVVFNLAHNPMCSHAVWLWNERKEYTIAHAIFRWLLTEAVAVGDEKAIELQTSNVACKR